MNEIVAPSPLLNLFVVIRGLRGAVGGWVRPGMLSIPLVVLLFRRLCEICGRMERLVARYQAGRLVQPGPRLGGAERGVAKGRVPLEGGRIWPGKFGWLVWTVGYQAAGYGSQLRHILEQPEMLALLEAAPQAARILRPLCRMLAIEDALLRPGMAGADVGPVVAAAPVEKKKRVRKKRPPIDWGRIPLPRGVLTAARRQGYGKMPRE